MGRVCVHINHFCYHIKEIGLWKAWGATILKGSVIPMVIVVTYHFGHGSIEESFFHMKIYFIAPRMLYLLSYGSKSQLYGYIDRS